MITAACLPHVKINDDLTGIAGQVFKFDVFAEMLFQLLQQRQRVMIVAEAHGFTGPKG